MSEKKEEKIEKAENVEKKNNGLLVTCLVIVLMAVCSAGGFLIGTAKTVTKYNNNLEKNITESKTEKETEKEETTEKETIKEDTTNCKEEKTEETTIDNSNTVEKVYGWYDNTITLFKSGKCVVTKGSEYTNACKYTINNNTLTMTSRETGPNNGTETTYTYNITTDSNNTEYLELSTNKETKYKLFD